MDSMKIFRGIPMFHGKCSRMPAIEFAIQILVVLLLGAGAVIGETTEKNETLIASLNVTETTSCKNLNYF
jgi:hypothetical protein